MSSLRPDVVPADVLKRVDEVAERAKTLRVELMAALLEAHEAGYSTRKIAPYARLSHNRVAELIREAKARDVDVAPVLVHCALFGVVCSCLCLLFCATACPLIGV